MNALPPAGWFPDPEGSNRLRYWDGTAWTAHYAPLPSDQQASDVQQTHHVSSSESQYHYTSGTGAPVVAEVGGMKKSTKWKIGGVIAGLLILILIVVNASDEPKASAPSPTFSSSRVS